MNTAQIWLWEGQNKVPVFYTEPGAPAAHTCGRTLRAAPGKFITGPRTYARSACPETCLGRSACRFRPSSKSNPCGPTMHRASAAKLAKRELCLGPSIWKDSVSRQVSMEVPEREICSGLSGGSRFVHFEAVMKQHPHRAGRVVELQSSCRRCLRIC